MKKKTVTLLFLTVMLTCCVSLLYGWGFWVHQRVNRAAVFTLPEEMRVFFYNHIDFISEESVIPDVRKYAIPDREESNRHYIDLENLQHSPSEMIPQSWSLAVQKYGDSMLQKNGILPWYIDTMMGNLTKAFRSKDKPTILFLAADLGHYIGDAHVPLHTSVNHDGQMTGQRGIHAFWESQLPELFGNAYNFHTHEAVYISDVRKEIWKIIDQSHLLVDTLLLAEKKLRTEYPNISMYDKDSAGNVIKSKFGQWIHSHEYAKKYNELLNGMIEKQAQLTVADIGSFWYTAWVNAGKPDLHELDPPSLTKRNKKNYKNELKLWNKGKLFGLKTDREF